MELLSSQTHDPKCSLESFCSGISLRSSDQTAALPSSDHISFLIFRGQSPPSISPLSPCQRTHAHVPLMRGSTSVPTGTKRTETALRTPDPRSGSREVGASTCQGANCLSVCLQTHGSGRKKRKSSYLVGTYFGNRR